MGSQKRWESCQPVLLGSEMLPRAGRVYVCAADRSWKAHPCPRTTSWVTGNTGPKCRGLSLSILCCYKIYKEKKFSYQHWGLEVWRQGAMAWQGFLVPSQGRRWEGRWREKEEEAAFLLPLWETHFQDGSPTPVVISRKTDGSRTPITLSIIFNIVFLYFENAMDYILLFYLPPTPLRSTHSTCHPLQIPYPLFSL